MPLPESSWSSDSFNELFDPDRLGGYPGNHMAFRHVLNALHQENAKSLVEVGVGGGNAIPIFSAAGLTFYGFDNKPEMVDQSRKILARCGLGENQAVWADIEDSITLTPVRAAGPFDGLVAMGILPHVEHERAALRNMWQLVKPGGTVFVECRNKLFSLITFNRFSYEFIMDDLFEGVSQDVRAASHDFLASRLDLDIPPKATGHTARQHNPLDIEDLFLDAGFIDTSIIPFHYHASLPRLEKPLGKAFRSESIKMENEPSGWKGLFLCSAFLVQARRPL
jgi:2-polyprenyl-3-methyl-5-hydroxy-6-metoxy-1,4-benzoquinol methylase